MGEKEILEYYIYFTEMMIPMFSKKLKKLKKMIPKPKYMKF